jgi:hypothetical protein
VVWQPGKRVQEYNNVRMSIRRAGVIVAVLIAVVVTGAGLYVWSIDRQYDKARDQAELVRSRVSSEDGSSSLAVLPQITQDLTQLEVDLRELDRRVDRPLIGGIARNTPYLGERLKASQQLLDLGIELTEISRDTSEIANEIRDAFETNGFMGSDPVVGPTWLDVVAARRDDINDLERRYDAALQARAELDVEHLLGRALNTLETVDGLLQRGTDIRDEYFHLFPLLDAAFGAEEDARYLILMQNGQELRAAGGFIGTYGMMTISNGRIAELDISPIGFLDQAYADARSEVLPAPPPIREYLGQIEWLPRDSNWLADFPLVARDLSAMYADTGWPPLQGIVAVNDSAVQAVLEIIGPYEFSTGGKVQKVDPESFIDLIQSYRNQGERHKEIVGELGRSLIDQVRDADFDTKKEVFWRMRDSANEREIQVVMLDPEMQAEVTSRGWDGALLPDPDLQTLILTIANVTGNKASPNVWVNAGLDLSVNDAGDRAVVEWSILLTHIGDPDGPLEYHGFHRTWLQVYLPEDATLLSSSREPAPAEMTDDARAIGYHVELHTGEQELLTLEFELPLPTADLLLRRQSGLRNVEYAVTGGLSPDCTFNAEVFLSHDHLVDVAACSVQTYIPSEQARE